MAIFGSKVVMGLGQKFLTRVGLGRVSHLWFGFEFGKFPLKMSTFSIFSLWSESTRVEGRWASYLLRVKSKLGSGQGPSLIKSQLKYILALKHLQTMKKWFSWNIFILFHKTFHLLKRRSGRKCFVLKLIVSHNLYWEKLLMNIVSLSFNFWISKCRKNKIRLLPNYENLILIYCIIW